MCVCFQFGKSFPCLQRFVDSKQKSKQKVLALWGDFPGGGRPQKSSIFMLIMAGSLFMNWQGIKMKDVRDSDCSDLAKSTCFLGEMGVR